MSGKLLELWRYPVSSMGGERIAHAALTEAGIIGDRIWGLVDASTGRIASPGREKHFAKVPSAFARAARFAQNSKRGLRGGSTR